MIKQVMQTSSESNSFLYATCLDNVFHLGKHLHVTFICIQSLTRTKLKLQ